MQPSCKVCSSPKRPAIDARLEAAGRGNSLRKVAAAFGFNLRQIWQHSRHARDGAAETADSSGVLELRKLLKQHRALYEKAVRSGALDVAARQLGAIGEVQSRIQAETGRIDARRRPASDTRPGICKFCGRPCGEMRFVVRYEDGDDRSDEAVIELRGDAAAKVTKVIINSFKNDQGLCELLIQVAEREGATAVLQAAICRVVALLRGLQLPKELDEKIRISLDDVKGELK